MAREVGEQMRVMLDTNIWSEIGRRDSRLAIEGLALARRWRIQTPPATLLEAIMTPDPDARGKILEVLSSRHWTRLRTEADQESAELISEARRLRPRWVRQLPLPGSPAHYRNFWQKTIWREARKDSELLRAVSVEVHSAADSEAFKVQKFNRDQRVSEGQDVRDLRHIVLEPEDWSNTAYLMGWKPGERVEWWRVQARDVFWNALRTAPIDRMRGQNSTYTDWLEPYLHVDEMQSDGVDFTRFWFDEVEQIRMPRVWLRWAVQTAQMMGRITPSSPRDDQLSAYLIDCDIFVTADRRFARAIALTAANSSFDLPSVVTFPSLESKDSAVQVLSDSVL
jgi:predicted nucleic acid-binding protein